MRKASPHSLTLKWKHNEMVREVEETKEIIVLLRAILEQCSDLKDMVEEIAILIEAQAKEE